MIQKSLKKGRTWYECNQHFLQPACHARHDPPVPMDASADTTDDWGSITEDVPSLRIDYIHEISLFGVWRRYGFNALISKQPCHQSSLRFNANRAKGDQNMKKIKFVVRVNRTGNRLPQYIQRIDPTPMHMTTNRKLALLMGRFMAEDAVKSLQNSRCIPELVSVELGA